MFIARLKVLEITVPIGFKFYHDDGYVDSIGKHLEQLAKKYSNIRTKDYIFEKEAGGWCIEGVSFLRRNLHIFYLDYKSTP